MRAHALIAVAVLAAPAVARAAPVAVRVIDTAGDVAFVAPGRDAGLVPGVTVRFGARSLVVVEATAATAVVQLGGAPLAIGASGVAEVTPGTAAAAVARLPAPRPLEAWRGQWAAAPRPADAQHPRPIPLGEGGPPGRLHASLILHGQGVLAREPEAGAELRAAVSYQLLADRPFALDVDASARAYLEGRAGARGPLWVHRAQLRYGDAGAPALALGRLAWAASGVGMLDGVRAATRVGDVELAGFGGVVPDPIDGRPDPGATRFGAEAIYDAPAAPGQPRLSLTLVGSTWSGALDERRATAAAEVSRGPVTASGWAEGQLFSADNPWGARTLELTGAGLALDWQRRGQRASVDVSFARPERTLRLAAALPPDWLCWRAPGADPAAEPCGGDDRTLVAGASIGRGGARWNLDAGVRASRTVGLDTADELSAYGLGELRLRPGLRALAGGAGGRTGFLDWYEAEVGLAFDRGRRWELAVRYRPALVAYVGALDRFVQHTAAVDGRLRLGPTLDVALAAAASAGADRDALAVLATIAWRVAP